MEHLKAGGGCDSLSRLSPTLQCEMEQVTVSYYVPRVFHKHISKIVLINASPCKLKLSSCRKSQNVRIIANSQETVSSVVNLINNVIATTRPKLRPSHFICLPIQDSESVENYKIFKSKVLEEAEANPLYGGIDKDLFISECKLHLTFATLLLVDQREVEMASRLLVNFFDESEFGKEFSSAPFCVTIRGLASMQTNSDHSHVLYATVQKGDDYERLQGVANAISRLFLQHGLHSGVNQTLATTTDVRLHMTLMNSRNRMEKQLHRGSGSERRCLKRRYFSATSLLAAFGDYSFTERTVFDTISLCRMHSGGTGSFYATEAQLKLSGTGSAVTIQRTDK